MFHSKWTLIMSMQNVYDCLSPPERLGNAPVGSNSSGPAVIPSVSEGGTMVGERSMRKTSQASSFGGRWRIPIVVRNMPNRRGRGTFLMMGRLIDNVGIH